MWNWNHFYHLNCFYLGNHTLLCRCCCFWKLKNHPDDPNVKVCLLDHLFFHQNLVFSSPHVSARQFLCNFVVQSFCGLHPEKTETDDDSSSDQIDFDFFSGADDEDGGPGG